MKSTINNNIKSIRELKNYTQQHMALHLGITQAGYSKLENTGSNFSYEKLEKIAQIFDINIVNIINFNVDQYLVSNKDDYHVPAIIKLEDIINVKVLYENKITLLELLLHKTDSELGNYKKVYGEFLSLNRSVFK
jgi:transcriptional regulator with XRE-family HTH domain